MERALDRGNRGLKLCIAAALAAGCAAASAQDTRTVTEPVVPPVCKILRAELTADGNIAPADEYRLDTERLQQGIDECAEGHALELALDSKHNAFLTGPIRLKPGVTLLVDKDVTLYGTRDAWLYEKSPGSCGVVNEERAGCHTLIVAEHAANAGIMGEGTIDGRGGARLLREGKAETKTWWGLAEDARKSGRQQVPRLIEMSYSDNFTLYKITLKNAANFHVVYHHGDGLTVWGIKIDTPKNARNTDGIDPSGSKNITVTRSFIRTGDDNIAIKGGNEGPVTNMTVAHNHFYWGHGMSIGSETNSGVSAIRVTDLSLDGDDDGIRIKSNPARGGLVHDVIYDDICIRNSKAPIFLDTEYALSGKDGVLLPVYEDITLRNVRISGGGKFQINGLDKAHHIGVQFDGVELSDSPGNYDFAVNHADVKLGPGSDNFPLQPGLDATVGASSAPVNHPLQSCKSKFVPFPGSVSVEKEKDSAIADGVAPLSGSVHAIDVDAIYANEAARAQHSLAERAGIARTGVARVRAASRLRLLKLGRARARARTLRSRLRAARHRAALARQRAARAKRRGNPPKTVWTAGTHTTDTAGSTGK